MTEQSVKNTPQHETQSKPKQKTVKLIIKRQDIPCFRHLYLIFG